MQFVMTKVDVLRLLERNGIPHAPTFVMKRPRDAEQFEDAFRAMVTWLRGLSRLPRCLVTKSSHSGKYTDIGEWDWLYLLQPEGAEAFVDHAYDVLVRDHKPYLLVQPFCQQLSHAQYRHYFVNGRFRSCIRTSWRRDRTGWRLDAEPVYDEGLLAATVPLAAAVVALLPKDSALWRIDLFRNHGEWGVNGVGMVDASLFPDDQPDGVRIVRDVAARLLQLQDTDPPICSPLEPSVPILDDEYAASVSSKHCHIIARGFRRDLIRCKYAQHSQPRDLRN